MKLSVPEKPAAGVNRNTPLPVIVPPPALNDATPRRLTDVPVSLASSWLAENESVGPVIDSASVTATGAAVPAGIGGGGGGGGAAQLPGASGMLVLGQGESGPVGAPPVLGPS